MDFCDLFLMKNLDDIRLVCGASHHSYKDRFVAGGMLGAEAAMEGSKPVFVRHSMQRDAETSCFATIFRRVDRQSRCFMLHAGDAVRGLLGGCAKDLSSRIGLH
jgi:hypothetical protein